MTARLNDIDPQAWLADVFARIGRNRTDCLQILHWEWKRRNGTPAATAAA